MLSTAEWRPDVSDFRYEVEIDLENENTSHAAVVDLVGWNRRVLDVGCATGALGAVLEKHDCQVVGVEVSERAAEVARERLTEVLVGDVATLGLVERFGEASFDVVIFADVLEHLSDPGAVLRSVLPLLRPQGFVVISLPNIAHGAVRLALLGGSFRYTDVGLLDRTHLRFFTRESVDDLVRQAGLAITDLRRTTAGLFDTEINVDPSAVPADVVRLIEEDDEATTYQFVVKAVRDDAEHSVATLRRRYEEAAAERDDLVRAPSTRAATGTTRWPAGARQVAVWAFSDTDDPLEALRSEIVVRELQRRLPEDAVRAFAPLGPLRRCHVPARAVEALGERTPERGADLQSDLDCVVITGRVSARLEELTAPYGGATRWTHPSTFLAFPGEAVPGVPVIYSAVDATIDAGRADDEGLLAQFAKSVRISTTSGSLAQLLGGPSETLQIVADPVALAPRLAHAYDLRVARAALATSLGSLDRTPYIVLHGDGSHIDDVRLLVQAVRRLRDERADVIPLAINVGGVPGEGAFSAAVAAQVDGCAILTVPTMSATDVLAVISGASVVVTTSRGVAELATAFGVPSLHHTRPGSSLVDGGSLLTAIATLPAPCRTDVVALDEHFDDVAAFVRTIAVTDDGAAPAAFASRMAAVEAAAHAAIETTRVQQAALIARIRASEEAVEQSARSQHDLATLRQRLAEVERELAGVLGTKAVRVATLASRMATAARRAAGGRT